MFYCYNSPAPDGIDQEPLSNGAFWGELNGSPYALMRYEDWRNMHDPKQGLLNFLQSSYEAGARRAAWDRQALER